MDEIDFWFLANKNEINGLGNLNRSGEFSLNEINQ